MPLPPPIPQHRLSDGTMAALDAVFSEIKRPIDDDVSLSEGNALQVAASSTTMGRTNSVLTSEAIRKMGYLFLGRPASSKESKSFVSMMADGGDGGVTVEGFSRFVAAILLGT